MNAVIFFAATLVAYAGVLPFVDRALARDWHYFNALSLVVRSNILNYHRLPLHDPWVAGGVDILANPQSRVFSPFVLLDILFDPQTANLISLMLYCYAGLWGMYLLLRSLLVREKFAVLGAVLFIFSSWFGLHYAEGHIPFGAMQLLPWALYFARELPSTKSIVGLAALLAWMLLDGQIYPAIFSILLVLSSFAVGLVRVGCFSNWIRQWHVALLAAIGFVMITAPKTIPVLSQHMERKPSLEVDILGWRAALNMFFYPRHVIWTSLNEPSHWGFHEYGCYIGLLAFGLFVFKAFRLSFLRVNARFLILIGFWLWTAMGWFYPLNPWFVFQQLPLVKNAHVNSRVLILALMFFVIILVKILQDQKRTRILFAICALLAVEAAVIRNQAFFRQATKSWEGKSSISALIESQTIERTVPYGYKPLHYYDRNTGSVSTYEPAAPRTMVKATHDPGYRGEVYYFTGSGEANLLEYTPAKIRLAYAASEPAKIVVNTNTLDVWGAQGTGNPTLISAAGDLLTIAVEAGRGEIELRYQPRYLDWIVPFFAIGLLIFGGLIIYCVRLVFSKTNPP